MNALHSLALIALTLAAIFVPQLIALHLRTTRKSHTA
jgi:hypothetical protein